MTPVTHFWVDEQLESYVLFGLPEAERQLWVEHVRGCGECGPRFGRYLPESEAHDAHIPAEVLGRWPVMQHELRGLERKLVRRHLELCAHCREDLALLGFDPTLVEDASLERLADSVSMTRSTNEAPRRRMLPWALGGWASLATAAALALLFAPRPPSRMPSLPPTAVGRATQPQPSPAASPASALALRVPTITLQATTRGPEAPVPALDLGADEPMLRLAFRPPLWEDGVRVRIELSGPGETLLASRSARIEQLSERDGVTFASQVGWRDGGYALRLVRDAQAGAPAETASFRFRLRRKH